jgi:hypothetical protein
MNISRNDMTRTFALLLCYNHTYKNEPRFVGLQVTPVSVSGSFLFSTLPRPQNRLIILHLGASDTNITISNIVRIVRDRCSRPESQIGHSLWK